MKILATSLPAPSHFNRVLEVAQALKHVGHDVLYVGSAAFSPKLAVAGIDHVVGGADEFPETSIHDETRWRAETESFLIEHAGALCERLLEVSPAFQPDLLVRDFSEKAGGIFAEIEGLSQLTVACTAFSSLERFTKPSSWMNRMRRELGLTNVHSTSGESPGTSIAFGPREFYDVDAALIRRLSFVRHENRHPLQQEVFDVVQSWINSERPTILVSLGTIVPKLSGAEYEYIAAELSHLPVNAVYMVPGEAGRVDRHGENGLVVRGGPQQQLLELADVLVCHAGINSVMEALSCGRPVVNVPVFFDQFFLAERCEKLGLGPTVALRDARPGTLVSKVDDVLTKSRYGEVAKRLAIANAATNSVEETLAENQLG
jgi:UDP:flavonoid glycosyltransferase YjiC (YdhE family)